MGPLSPRWGAPVRSDLSKIVMLHLGGDAHLVGAKQGTAWDLDDHASLATSPVREPAE